MSSPPLNTSLPLDTCDEEEAEEIERKCNQLIEEVLKSPKEYTTKNLEGYESELKEDLMKFLKRGDMIPTKIADYQYGFSTKLEANKRLIVIEKDDRTKCREYSAYRTYDQFCLQCRSLSNHKVLLYSRIIQGILFVPVKHFCAPKEYDAVMEVQEKMKEGDLKAALSLQRKYAVRKHPIYLFPKEKPRKRSKATSSTSKSGKLTEAGQMKDTVEAASAAEVAEGHNDIDLSCCESLKDDVSDGFDSSMINQQLNVAKNVDTSSSPGAAGKPDVLFQSDQLEDLNNNASTFDVKPLDASEMMEAEEDTVTDDRSDSKHEATSPSDSQTAISSNDPSQASSSIDTKRGHKGRKRGSKNLLFAKNSLDLIDAIKSLLPPDENSAPKKRRRRRKACIQASSSEGIKLDDDENLDLIASTNVTATILDMINTELLNSKKYTSENSTTSEAENTDDCEILEDNLYLPMQHKDHQVQYIRTRSETITIED